MRAHANDRSFEVGQRISISPFAFHGQLIEAIPREYLCDDHPAYMDAINIRFEPLTALF